MAVPLHALLFNGPRFSFDFTIYWVSFHYLVCIIRRNYAYFEVNAGAK